MWQDLRFKLKKPNEILFSDKKALKKLTRRSRQGRNRTKILVMHAWDRLWKSIWLFFDLLRNINAGYDMWLASQQEWLVWRRDEGTNKSDKTDSWSIIVREKKDRVCVVYLATTSSSEYVHMTIAFVVRVGTRRSTCLQVTRLTYMPFSFTSVVLVANSSHC